MINRRLDGGHTSLLVPDPVEQAPIVLGLDLASTYARL